MKKLIEMLYIGYKLGGLNGERLKELFVIKNYLINLKGSFIELLQDQLYYMVMNVEMDERAHMNWKDKIWNKHIWEKVSVASIEEKMVGNCLNMYREGCGRHWWGEWNG